MNRPRPSLSLDRLTVLLLVCGRLSNSRVISRTLMYALRTFTAGLARTSRPSIIIRELWKSIRAIWRLPSNLALSTCVWAVTTRPPADSISQSRLTISLLVLMSVCLWPRHTRIKLPRRRKRLNWPPRYSRTPICFLWK